MPESEVRISGGIFLFSFTYWSNCASSARRIASTSVVCAPRPAGPARVGAEVRALVGDVAGCARAAALDQHLHRAVGQLQHLQDVRDAADVVHVLRARARPSPPTSARRAGSLLPASIAVSIALIDFGRPTNSGITMCGKTTTSRSGKQREYCDGKVRRASFEDMDVTPGEGTAGNVGAAHPRDSSGHAARYLRPVRRRLQQSAPDPATLGWSE